VSPADSFGTAIGVGIGIGVGIDLTNPISARLLADRIATLSFHMLAVALGSADRLDGRTLYVELLMTEWHRAFSLSIPIPIPTPIALRRCLDSVVSGGLVHKLGQGLGLASNAPVF
jgi:hypothetical protein